MKTNEGKSIVALLAPTILRHYENGVVQQIPAT